MITVVCDGREILVDDLAQAMTVARELGRWVVIRGLGFEIVGVFGVDSVQDGLCPDGVAYDWNKTRGVSWRRRQKACGAVS